MTNLTERKGARRNLSIVTANAEPHGIARGIRATLTIARIKGTADRQGSAGISTTIAIFIVIVTVIDTIHRQGRHLLTGIAILRIISVDLTLDPFHLHGIGVALLHPTIGDLDLAPDPSRP